MYWLRSVITCTVGGGMRCLILNGGGGGARRGSGGVVLFTGLGATTILYVQHFHTVCQLGDIISVCLLCGGLWLVGVSPLLV